MTSSITATARQARRAPVRVAASVLAIALAIAAIGVFAVPGVARQSLRSIAADDALAHLVVETSSLDDFDLDPATVGADAIAFRTEGTLTTESHGSLLLVGTDPSADVDAVRIIAGRAAESRDELVVTDGVARIGETIDERFSVVGIAETTWFATDDVAFTSVEMAQATLGIDGINRIAVRVADPTAANLDDVVSELRTQVEGASGSFVSFPVKLPDNAHPIEQDIEMISFMIGGLGVVAGVVALILLASTANSIVTERSRDAAIMRALGGSRREVRRELRRPAIAIGAVGTLIGLPLGIVVANVIARMVLDRFAGLTPDVGIDPIVLAASAVFGIVGARLVSGRVARRVARAELATALRDRDGLPFGQRWSNRLLARVPTGGLIARMAVRATARRRARSLGITAQIGGAVAAAVLVAGLGSSIVAFNTAELDSYRWESVTTAVDPVHPFPLVLPAEGAGSTEVGIRTYGTAADREIDVTGVDPSTAMFDTEVSAGRWLDDADARQVVVAERLGEQDGHAIGDLMEIELAGGPATFEVVGHHPIRSVGVFVPVEALAEELATNGHGNTVWASTATPSVLGAPGTETVDRDRLFAEDAAARDAILAIFAAIGVIVVTIAAIGTSSTVAMSLFERRDEMATLLAVGGERRALRSLIRTELAPLALIGLAVGSVAGVFGGKAIMAAFANANAIELGFAMPWVAFPLSVVAVAAFVQLLAVTSARNVTRQGPAVTLRAAT